ncbi:AMP-binding protein [Massilia sp. B-10]|nr:AMP-binding protein [Massilia sp. B-10]
MIRAVSRACRSAAWRLLNLVNGYGPTETTTFAATCAIGAVSSETRRIPIGRPIANTSIYILDRHLKAVPMGVAGEIYIGGDGVARGYINRPDLTAERFLADPFSGQPGARMYKTGDLGCWLADGQVDYLGRNDFQVKLRGFRIELGEIEARLMACAGVREARPDARRCAWRQAPGRLPAGRRRHPAGSGRTAQGAVCQPGRVHGSRCLRHARSVATDPERQA